MIDQSKTLLFWGGFFFEAGLQKHILKRKPCCETGPASTAGAAGDARALPILPHHGQAQAGLRGYCLLSFRARFQPRIYTVKSKIPGRQGLARWECRCCLCSAAVIMPPNLESSGRAVCSATIRRLFNCSAVAYCFPLPGSGCQQPAECQEPHCKPRHAGSLAVPAPASSGHQCCGNACGQEDLGTASTPK